MPKIPGVNHLDAVRGLEKVGFRILRQSKHIVMSDGVHCDDSSPQSCKCIGLLTVWKIGFVVVTVRHKEKSGFYDLGIVWRPPSIYGPCA